MLAIAGIDKGISLYIISLKEMLISIISSIDLF